MLHAPRHYSQQQDFFVLHNHSHYTWLKQNNVILHCQTLSFQTTVIPQEMITMLFSINYTDQCILTDINLNLRMESGWHPSFFVMYDMKAKEKQIVAFRHNKDCAMNTTTTLSENKQGLYCTGGRRHACGLRNLPEKGHVSHTLFMKQINLDPKGEESYTCSPDEWLNAYTFVGSYYHAYVKLASCLKPKGGYSFLTMVIVSC